MEWISVDTEQPSDERPVLVSGYFKERKFVTLGKYYRESNWWMTLAESWEFIMIEMTSDEKNPRNEVNVKFWMPLPELPED